MLKSWQLKEDDFAKCWPSDRFLSCLIKYPVLVWMSDKVIMLDLQSWIDDSRSPLKEEAYLDNELFVE